MNHPVSRVALIVGLGNPGSEYQDTRHNAGAWLVEMLCQQHRLSLKTESQWNARVAHWRFNSHECKLIIPNTYMNHSGQAVGAVAKYYQIPSESILIAHDELDLQPGVVRFKSGGGHGGHNGLRDIINHLSNRDFHRLRLGIGHPGHKDQVTDYVLHEPSQTEAQKIRAGILAALGVLPEIMTGQWQTATRHLHHLTN